MADTPSYKTFDIKIEQGSTFFLSITLENQEGYILNIKDCLAVMQIRELKQLDSKVLLDVTPYLKFTVDNKILVEVPSAVTNGIKWSSGFYDLKVKELTTSRVYRLLEGGVTVDQQVTDDIWSSAARFIDSTACNEIDTTTPEIPTNTGDV